MRAQNKALTPPLAFANLFCNIYASYLPRILKIQCIAM